MYVTFRFITKTHTYGIGAATDKSWRLTAGGAVATHATAGRFIKASFSTIKTVNN